MKKIQKGANIAWKIIIGATTLVTLVFGTLQAYNHFSTPDISGTWQLTLNTESSTMKAYVGDVTIIRAYFAQSENSLVGQGEKWAYRGKLLDYKQHRKLEFTGSLNKKTLNLSFVLHGLLRETSGIIQAEVSENGRKMIGTFSGTAADTKGRLTAVKID